MEIIKKTDNNNSNYLQLRTVNVQLLSWVFQNHNPEIDLLPVLKGELIGTVIASDRDIVFIPKELIFEKIFYFILGFIINKNKKHAD